jgi:hypothetical protein
MMLSRTVLVPICAGFLAWSGAVAAQPVTYGSKLMSPQEHAAHRQTMQSLTPEQRQAYRSKHHEQMKERAKELGYNLPQQPPIGRGPGMGPRSGYGPAWGYGPRGGPGWERGPRRDYGRWPGLNYSNWEYPGRDEAYVPGLGPGPGYGPGPGPRYGPGPGYGRGMRSRW